MNSIFRWEFLVPSEAVDLNGHVNNVVYVQWMQDVAVRHSDSVGCTGLTESAGATWVVRSHRIEYLTPAHEGDRVILETWVAETRRVRSLRRYKFVRGNDQAVLAEGETDWVFVDRETGRPKMIPDSVRNAFEAAL